NYGLTASIDSKNGETEALANAVENLGARRGFGRGRGHGGNQFGNNQAGRGRGNVSLTKDQYNSLMALLERNPVDGTKHATNMVRGESSHCYSAGVAGKYHDHNSKFKNTECEWILDTGATD
ncbi:hypothetical protein A2U01_0045654, partial [Trifolium medium]|nr:hypothetical protein [Trifolium medium]